MSSKPTTLTSPGTAGPVARAASHGADRHRVAHGQDRRSDAGRPPRRRRRRRLPPSTLAGPTTTWSSGRSMPGGRERRPVALQAAADDAVGVGLAPGRRRLDADDQDVPVAERRAGARRRRAHRPRRRRRPPPCSGKRGRVDQHDREPARRICSTSGWSSHRPIATTPSTVARLMARASEPWSGDTKRSA